MNTWLPVLGQWRRSQDSDSISLADGKCGLPIVTGLESLLTGALQNLKFYTLSSLPLGTLWERLSSRDGSRSPSCGALPVDRQIMEIKFKEVSGCWRENIDFEPTKKHLHYRLRSHRKSWELLERMISKEWHTGPTLFDAQSVRRASKLVIRLGSTVEV